MNNFFIDTINGKTAGALIMVTFKNGAEAGYTSDVLTLLKTDPAVKYITDAETGELLFSAAINN